MAPEAPLRVALVDDHAIVLEAMALLVGSEPGFTVAGRARTVGGTFTMLDETDPDVLVMDLGMGEEGGGVAFVERVAGLRPELPIVVLSMFSEDVYAERAIRAGALGYVMKSHAAEALMDAIRVAARGSVYLSPQLRERILRRMRQGHGEESAVVALLTDRELDVFRLLGQGRSSREVADGLGLSVKTVETHRLKIMRKLGLSGSSELVYRAILWVQQEMGLP